jgi:hypothetical protein
MKISSKIINEIKSCSKNNLDKETCGFVVEKENDVLFIQVENKHPDARNFFLVSPKDYLNIKNNFKILYFFHSHVDNAFFSELDIFHQKYHNMNMLLYNIETNQFKELKCK